MITSRLSSKGQTTVPRSVRESLRLEEGDTLTYELNEGFVIIRKDRAGTADDPFLTFDEWETEADRRAYEDL